MNENINIDTLSWTSDHGNDLPSDKNSSPGLGSFVGGDKLSKEEPLTNECNDSEAKDEGAGIAVTVLKTWCE